VAAWAKVPKSKRDNKKKCLERFMLG